MNLKSVQEKEDIKNHITRIIDESGDNLYVAIQDEYYHPHISDEIALLHEKIKKLLK